MSDKKKDAPKTVDPTPRVVAGAATFSGHGGLATTPRAAQLEAAMSDAVLQALADGVSIDDGDTIKAYKAAARQAVKERLGG